MNNFVFLELQTNDGLLSRESTEFAKQGPTGSKPSETKGLFGRVLNFKQYYEKKTGLGRQVVSGKVKKGKGKGTEEKDKVQNLEVTIFIGLMKWSEEDLKLKPMRGKRVALKVSREAPYKFCVRKQWRSGKLTTITFMMKMKIMFFYLTVVRRQFFCQDQQKNFFH